VNTVKTDFSALRKFRSQLDELEKGRAQVGLFQETATRSADPGRISDNPSLGAIHEFGNTAKKIPERSWLRMPLTLKLGDAIRLREATDWISALRKSGAKRVLGFLGALGEDVVQEAFATRGWGAWPSLQPATIRKKGSSAILIESSQMRKAVSSRVV
jgi:hypothetical protein